MTELSDPRPEDERPGEPGERALVVHDRRSGEILHAPREQPAVRAPDPVGRDRVDPGEEDAEDEVDPKLRPLGHRAPDDRERHACEDDLEQVARCTRDLGEPVERLLADGDELVHRREEARGADDPVAVTEREAEADRPVDDRAHGEDEHVLAGDVARVLHARQPGLEEREACLHEHDEHGGHDDPDRARGDQQVLVGDRSAKHRPPPPSASAPCGCASRSPPDSSRRGRRRIRFRSGPRRRSPRPPLPRGGRRR